MNTECLLGCRRASLQSDEHHVAMEAFVSVYVGWAATKEEVRDAARSLPMPSGVERVEVSGSSDTLGCRTVIDLFGKFDPQTEGRLIAHRFAKDVSDALGVEAFALQDLILGAGRTGEIGF